MKMFAFMKSRGSKSRTLFPVILILFVLLAACGGSTDPTTVPPSLPTVEPTEEQIVPTSEPTEEMPATTEEAPAVTEAPPAGDTNVSFSQDVFPLLQRCQQCHGADRQERGLVLLSYADLMAGSQNGPVIILGDADSSKLVELVANQKMPKRGAKLTPVQVQIITDWVNQGALDN
jgi:hypothetical protein